MEIFHFRIFSTGLVSQIYPGVIGEYVRMNLSAGHFYASSSKRQVYRKANFQDFFISKPPPTPQVCYGHKQFLLTLYNLD